MERYTKTINDEVIIKVKNQIVIEKNGMTTFNPTEEMLLEDGWVKYVPETPVVTEEMILETAKQNKTKEILNYDSSNAVNEFTMGGIPVWLDKVTRAGLMLRFQAEQAIGKTDTILWYEGMQFPITLELAMQILFALEVYASACYDNTQMHLANIATFGTADEIYAYDHTVGYPEKLAF